ncbi:MAG: hypothetical protein PVF65_11930, partial [Sphingomonadales bacterium]
MFSGGGSELSTTTGNLTIGSGQIYADAGLQLSSAGNLIVMQDGSVITAGDLFLNAISGIENAGDIASTGALTVNSGAFISSSGLLQSLTSIEVEGASLALAGTVLSDGGVTATALSGDAEVNGVLNSGESVSVSALSGDVTVGAAGDIASVGAITINAQGLLSNAGQIASNQAISLSGQGGLSNSGAVFGADRLELLSAASLNQSGTLDAAGDLVLQGAELNLSGVSVSGGQAQVTANVGALSVNGVLSSTNELTLTALNGGISLGVDAQVLSGQVILVNALNEIRNAGLISSNESITLNSQRDIIGDQTSSILSGGLISITSQSAVNNLGILSSNGGINVEAATINASGAISSNGNVNIDALQGSLTVDGAISTISSAILNAGGTLSVTGSGNIAVAGTLDINSNSSFVNSGQISSAADLDLSLNGSVSNTGLIVSGERLSLTGATNLVNGGTIAANLVMLEAESFDLDGLIASESNIDITSLSGTAPSAGNITIRGTVAASGLIDIDADQRFVVTSSGAVLSDGGTSIIAERISNAGEISSGAEVVLRSTGNLSNSGNILSSQRIDARSLNGTIANASNGRFEVFSPASAIVQGINNPNAANIALRSSGSLNNAGVITSNGSIYASSTAGSLINSGQISGGSGLTLVSNANFTNSGNVSSGLDLSLSLNQDFNNTAGITASRDLYIAAPNINNDALIGAGRNLDLRANGNLVNRSTLFAVNDINIGVGNTVHNDLGFILALGDLSIGGLTQGSGAGTLLNDSGRIEAFGSINIAANTTINRIRDFQVITETTETVEEVASTGDYPNTPDTITTTVDLETIVQNSGAAEIIAGGNLSVNSEILTNDKSFITAGNDIGINVGTLQNLGLTLETTTTVVHERTIRYCYPYVNVCFPQTETVSTTTTTEIEEVPAIIQAGGTLNITADVIENTGDPMFPVSPQPTGNPGIDTSATIGNSTNSSNVVTGPSASVSSGGSNVVGARQVNGASISYTGVSVQDGTREINDGVALSDVSVASNLTSNSGSAEAVQVSVDGGNLGVSPGSNVTALSVSLNDVDSFATDRSG